MNAFAERFVESAKSECLDQMVLPGEGHVPSGQSMAPKLKEWLAEIEKADAKAKAAPQPKAAKND